MGAPMTPAIKTLRRDLLAWANGQSPRVQAQAEVIAENLRCVEWNPYPQLIQQMAINVKALELLVFGRGND